MNPHRDLTKKPTLTSAMGKLFRFTSANARGFSLVEVLVATGIGCVILFFAGSLLVGTTISNLGALERMSTDEDVLQIEAVLKRTGRQGVNVNLWPPSGNNGWVRPFDSLTEPGPMIHFAHFLREARINPRIDIDGSLFRNTGLFFLKPVGTKQGVLFLDPGRDGDGSVSPGFDKIWVGHLVRARIPDPAVAPERLPTVLVGTQNRLRSFDVEVTFRQFGATVPFNQRCYNPVPANCPVDWPVGYDIVKNITVFLRDNDFGDNIAIDPSGAIKHRGLGSLYFFQELGGVQR